MPSQFLKQAIASLLIVLVGCAPPPGSSGTTRHPSDSPDRSAVGGTETPRTRTHNVLRRAVHWLRGRQAKDGGWHSPQYGILKSGQCYTPYVLDALQRVPRELWGQQPPDFAAAVDFIRRHASNDGVLGIADANVLEYPTYATAYAIPCLLSTGTAQDHALATKAQRFLVDQQFAELRGFSPDSPAYGGWGFGGTNPPGVTGHMDLAHARRALEALVKAPADDAVALAKARERARQFLAVVQKRPETKPLQPWPPEVPRRSDFQGDLPYDGGFYFSPIVVAANKGRHEPATATELPHYRSYATATCDGLLALLAAGVSKDDPRVVDAICWLVDHPRLDYPEGIPDDHPEPWGAALSFYHLAVRAEAYAAVGGPQGWQDDIVRLLAKEQRDDGSFRNDESPLMKEDDPIMATTLAVTALTRCLEHGADHVDRRTTARSTTMSPFDFAFAWRGL